MDKKICKLRSRNYSQVIEVKVPVRFYWSKDGYDGFEFGPLVECSSYQLRLLQQVTEQLFFEHQAAIVVQYLNDNHKVEWHRFLDEIETVSLDIPKTILDAFKDDERSR